MKSIRRPLLLLSGLCLGLISNIVAQNASPAAPKYRTNFLTYDVRNKSTATIFTLEGEWHAPNWSPDGSYIVSDMGGDLYRIPVSGANRGRPEKINVSQKMRATNDHALSWDGKQIAITAIMPPMPATIRTPADIHNSLFTMNADGSNAREFPWAGFMVGHPTASTSSTPSTMEITLTSTGSIPMEAANS